jgi:hypothetical protein
LEKQKARSHWIEWLRAPLLTKPFAKAISCRRRELLSQQTRVLRVKPLQQKAAPLLA